MRSGDYDFDETNIGSAYRALVLAAAILVVQGFAPNAWLELEENAGVHIASLSLKNL